MTLSKAAVGDLHNDEGAGIQIVACILGGVQEAMCKWICSVHTSLAAKGGKVAPEIPGCRLQVAAGSSRQSCGKRQEAAARDHGVLAKVTNTAAHMHGAIYKGVGKRDFQSREEVFRGVS